MSNHTPGPWLLDGRSIMTDGCAHSDRQSCVATVSGAREFGTVHNENELFANGCLLAAAPDMLAALRACEDRLGVLIECDNEDHGGACDDDVDAWSAARAAIAKAEGRS